MPESACTLCPRRCGADRAAGKGYCGAGEGILLSKAMLHLWEEPALGKKSGAIFFGGCPLHCIFCQNYKISSGERGKIVSSEELAAICRDLRAQGADNLDLVTPMHFAPRIARAVASVKEELGVPVIVNTGGYDSREQIDCFEGVADIYLPDYKTADPSLAKEICRAPDYPAVAERAIEAMLAQVGRPVYGEDGFLKKGVIVRHLVLPGHRSESVAALRRLRELFSPGEILLSLMSQYTPIPGMQKPFDRRITSFEYESVLGEADRLGFEGFCQERSSAKEEYTPEF